jgi:peptide/nickel transport system permease protein
MFQNSSSDFIRAYSSDRVALIGAILLAAVVLAALFAPWVAPQNPYDLSTLRLEDTKLPPGSRSEETGALYVFGTDEQGRDMLSAHESVGRRALDAVGLRCR